MMMIGARSLGYFFWQTKVHYKQKPNSALQIAFGIVTFIKKSPPRGSTSDQNLIIIKLCLCVYACVMCLCGIHFDVNYVDIWQWLEKQTKQMLTSKWGEFHNMLSPFHQHTATTSPSPQTITSIQMQMACLDKTIHFSLLIVTNLLSGVRFFLVNCFSFCWADTTETSQCLMGDLAVPRVNTVNRFRFQPKAFHLLGFNTELKQEAFNTHRKHIFGFFRNNSISQCFGHQNESVAFVRF